MISNPRHGLPPRLMAHQPTRFPTTQESSIRVHRPDPVSPSNLSPEQQELYGDMRNGIESNFKGFQPSFGESIQELDSSFVRPVQHSALLWPTSAALQTIRIIS